MMASLLDDMISADPHEQQNDKNALLLAFDNCVKFVTDFGDKLVPSMDRVYIAPELQGATHLWLCTDIQRTMRHISEEVDENGSTQTGALVEQLLLRAVNPPDAFASLREVERYAKSLHDFDDNRDTAAMSRLNESMTTWGALTWSVCVAFLSSSLERDPAAVVTDATANLRHALRAWRTAHPQSWTRPFAACEHVLL
jgi:hypothetical protein